MTDHYDITIVGAGLVGATFACALADLRLRVAVIEARVPVTDWDPSEYDLRVSAITQATRRIFSSLAVWPAISAQRVSPFREMHVWDAGGGGAIHFDSADIGESELGWVVENRVMLRALLEQMRACGDVDWFCPATVTSLARRETGATLTLGDGRSLHTQLVVAADGSASPVRGLAGIETRGWRYNQHAVVATIRTSESHRETAWQRFLPDGPLAFLPLEPNLCSIVWSTSPEHAEHLLALESDAFLDELQQAFGDVLGRMENCGPRAAFPLQLLHARQYVAERIALVGDAAHTVHPLAGQGVNLGLADAATLAEVIADAARAGKDIGTVPVLRRYERWRKGDNVLMMLVFDGFKRLFGTRAPPVRALRNVGLRLTDAAGPVKHLIMRRAMGLDGDLGRLARGQSLISPHVSPSLREQRQDSCS